MFCCKIMYVKLYSERGLTKMAAGNTLASKQSVILPIFPVKLKTAQKQKAHFARLTTGGMRLFCVQYLLKTNRKDEKR